MWQWTLLLVMTTLISNGMMALDPCKDSCEHTFDIDVLQEDEGFEVDGYIPEVADRLPEDIGVLVGRGIDVGRINENYLKEIGVPQIIINKLKPYLGLQGKEAEDKLNETPLVLTYDESVDLSTRVVNKFCEDITRRYNNAVKGNSTLKKFEALTLIQRSVIIFIYYQYGLDGAPDFWKFVTAQDWDSALDELNKIARNDEAQWLHNKVVEHWVNDNGTVIKEGQGCEDPHIRTFDGLKFNFQGYCSYILTKSSDNVTFPAFQVNANFSGVHDPRQPPTRMVDISLFVEGALVVKMYQDNTFQINGKRFKNTSAVIGNGDGNVDVDETNVYVQMIKPRLMLTWNGRQHKIKIRLDDTRMYGNVYGMLGNADGFSSNDLRKSDGKFTTKFEDFGNSWEIPGSCN